MQILEIAAKTIPWLIVVVIYFVRLEVSLAEIKKDLCYIKKEVGKCPQP